MKEKRRMTMRQKKGMFEVKRKDIIQHFGDDRWRNMKRKKRLVFSRFRK